MKKKILLIPVVFLLAASLVVLISGGQPAPTETVQPDNKQPDAPMARELFEIAANIRAAISTLRAIQNQLEV